MATWKSLISPGAILSKASFSATALSEQNEGIGVRNKRQTTSLAFSTLLLRKDLKRRHRSAPALCSTQIAWEPRLALSFPPVGISQDSLTLALSFVCSIILRRLSIVSSKTQRFALHSGLRFLRTASVRLRSPSKALLGLLDSRFFLVSDTFDC